MSSLISPTIPAEAQHLAAWFQENSRPLPWRESRDPYKIWISEIMLQQTTVTAVRPYYEKFVERFPTVKELAQAPIEQVYERWAGLGYYSRARNLHKAAQALCKMESFPKTYQELIELPGLGDYTARAVSSQAFGERVGVVDGNVIRVLSRRFDLPVEHWKNKEKKKLQEIADQYVEFGNPSDINQAFMELGATICTPTQPTCLLCPISKECLALENDTIDKRPLKKPRKKPEIWQWKADLYEQKGQVAFVVNQYAPFLKKQLILPGQVSQLETPPEDYDFQHGITHHKIFVKITRKKSKFKPENFAGFQWIQRNQLKEKVPFSLIQKAIDVGLGDNKA